MGSVGSTDQSCIIYTMKFLAVAITLVAAVSADADADAYYAPYFAPYAYGAYTFGGKSAPCVNAANVPVPCAGAPLAYAGYPYAAHYYGKRSADAEPEADPAVFYNAYGYGAFGAYPYGGIAATNNVVGHAVAYTPAGVTHSSNVGVCTNYLGAQVPC